jgi:hypothetical protein
VNILRRVLAVVLTAAGFLLIPLAASAARPQPIDLLVVGGTPSGVAAAVSAARHGERVELVARRDLLGGTLTDAMMDQWDLNLAPDGVSVQHGIFDEIYARLGDAFTPQSAARTFAAMVAAEPRITVRYGELPTAVDTVRVANGRRITRVIFRDVHSGATTALRAPLVIDATDFGDVAALAGAKVDVGRQDTGRDTRMQAVTLMFTIQDVDWRTVVDTYDTARYGPGGTSVKRAWGYTRLMKGYKPLSNRVLVRDLNLGKIEGGPLTVNAINILGVDGRDPKEVDQARRLTTLEANHLVDYLRDRLPGFAHARVGMFAPDVYVRETRHVFGLARLTSNDIWTSRIPSDSIGLSSYPIDLHPIDATEKPAYAPIRHVYGIPFGALVPIGITNLALASPAISASHLAAGSARVIPTTIEEGEAAGVAAAIAARTCSDFYTIAVSPQAIAQVRRTLVLAGAVVGSPSSAVTVAEAGPLARTAAQRK